MRFVICLLALVLVADTTVAQEEPKASQFYQVDVVEIGIAADTELPEKLEDSLNRLETLIKSGKVLCKESLRFSAMAGRKTTAAFGASVNVVQGVVQVRGKTIKNYMQQPVGTMVSVTLSPMEQDLVDVSLSYQATRVAGKSEGDQMTNFAQTQLTIDTQVKLREPSTLIARSEDQRKYIILTVRRD